MSDPEVVNKEFLGFLEQRTHYLRTIVSLFLDDAVDRAKSTLDRLILVNKTVDHIIKEIIHSENTGELDEIRRMAARKEELATTRALLREILSDPAHLPEKHGLWNALLEVEGVPQAARLDLMRKIRIEIARSTRPKWEGRIQRGGELATLTAPLFLKRVHASDIEQGVVSKEVIRAIDPDLMNALETYIAQRNRRGLDLGDADGLRFVATRPASQHSQNGGKRKPTRLIR